MDLARRAWQPHRRRETTQPADLDATDPDLQLDQTPSRSFDNRLQLGVDLELFDDVLHMPLHCVWRYPQSLRHRSCVERFGHELKHVELPRSELGQLSAVFGCLGGCAVLTRQRLDEEHDRN